MSTYPVFRFDNVGPVQNTTPTGDAATALLASNNNRMGVRIHNSDTARYLRIALLMSTASAPATVTTATQTDEIPPRSSVTYAAGSGVRVYGQFDDGLTGTADVNAQELY